MRWWKNSPWLSTPVIIRPTPSCSSTRMPNVSQPKESLLSTMTNCPSSRNACRNLHQLEVCQLLQCKDQLVYPEGLNRGLEPVLISLSGALVQGVNTIGEPSHKHLFLPVDLPQFTLGTTHLGTQLPAQYLHQLPFLKSLWNIPPRQIAILA